MPEKFYSNKIYPLQDKILKHVKSLNVDFYLTGGTALSRCYLQHRYSEDLDFFVNGNLDFKNQCEIVLSAFQKETWKWNVTTASESFVRIFIEKDNTTIKVDFVNDVPFHYGHFEDLPIFHRVDNWRNILSNKICALSRREPKDFADIICTSLKYRFEWEEVIIEAKEKDLWVDPLEICKFVKSFPIELLKEIKWIIDIDINSMTHHLKTVHDDIFYGKEKSLA